VTAITDFHRLSGFRLMPAEYGLARSADHRAAAFLLMAA
jgi:hypothetical protein